MDLHDTTEHATETDRNFDDNNEASKLVPVTESIRYRRRAQGAEKQAQELTEQLQQANEAIAHMSEQLEGLQRDQELTRKLSAAGAGDLETALLVAKARLKGQTKADVDACIEQLKMDKRHLFDVPSIQATPRRTAGVKDRTAPSTTALQKAAAQAARSGKRTDFQHYLRLRRSIL